MSNHPTMELDSSAVSAAIATASRATDGQSQWDVVEAIVEPLETSSSAYAT
jgi:hypothetical protein